MREIAANYGQALYDLACEEGLEEQLLQELETLEKVFSGEPEFIRLLASPNLSKDERCGIADKIALDRVHPYVCNTLKLMIEKGVVGSFCDCCKKYRMLYDDGHGIVAVTAVSAVELTGEQLNRLKDKLCSATGKTVRIQNRIDPSCMGGLRLDYDGKQLDGTVRTRLNSLRELLKNTVL